MNQHKYTKKSEYRRHKQRRRCRYAFRNLILLICFIVIVCCLILLRNVLTEEKETDIYGGMNAPFSAIQNERELHSEESVSIQSEESCQEQSIQNNEENLASDIPWNLTLANKWTSIPDNFEINLKEVESGGAQVDERIYESLMTMLEDAKAENGGMLPTVNYGYRTQEEQQKLYENKIAEYRNQGYSESRATEETEKWVALPGTSEHQLGLAVDIKGDTYAVFTWLQENSYKYGFIFRYPGYKTEITGIAEEVWHYRYVGVEAATVMHEQDLCLEEYLERYTDFY